ncbi:MAG: GNAT family N-acetyltransferase [Bacteroidota bacterium]|nr:GNAT family N-acetyltransferase [Bacteroidota bacterium]MDP4205511.1 GNAT family N-acetyltransferase [Bacteroidota bacterium]
MELEITQNTKANKFETTVNGHTAYIEYEIYKEIIDLIFTFVPQALEGKGIASALAKYALNYARDNHLKVRPFCHFVKLYIDRHKEYQDLLK